MIFVLVDLLYLELISIISFLYSIFELELY